MIIEAKWQELKREASKGLPWFLSVVSVPVGVEIRSNCDSFISEAIFTPLPVVHL